MSFITGNAETYQVDLPLFEKLGLKTFSISDRDQHFIGDVWINNSLVSIFVECYPAQFWQFKITQIGSDSYDVSTGSGSLSEYWPSIENIANGCLIV